jgi:chaperonin GroEL
MPKEMYFDRDTTAWLQAGVWKLAKAVKATMGPNGQNVIISKDGMVAITKDGVSVAMEVDLADPNENVAAQLLKQVAHKTVLETGDGTTTATVLAEAIFNKGLEQLDSGVNARYLFEGINFGSELVVKELQKAAIEAKTTADLQNIATISANGDEEVGEWIASAFEAVGHNGLVTAQISRESESQLELAKGIDFGSGYVSPIFLNDVDSGEIVYQRPLIYLYDAHIKEIAELMPILEHSSKATAPDGKPTPIVIIATGFDASLFQTLYKSKNAGLLRPVLIKAPGNGDTQITFFGDVAISTGAKLVSAKLGQSLKDLKSGQLISNYVGSCETITISANKTRIYEGAGSEESIQAYVAKLQELVDGDMLNESSKLMVRERISRLSKGIAIIHVGGESEVAARERYERVDDAIGATKAAIAEGYVPGGGHALLYARQQILNQGIEGNIDFQKGVQVVLDAIVAPFETIVTNSKQNITSVLAAVLAGTSEFKANIGYDARKDQVVDLLATGIIDPVKVTRRALQNATSIAALLLNSNVLMVKKPEKTGPTMNMQL